MKTKKSQALERIIALMNESFDAEDIMKLAIAYSVVKRGVILPERYYSCSKCGGRGHLSKRNFCDFCGASMTDAAVGMVMERLEALGYDKDD